MAYAARQKGVPPRAYLWQGAWVLHTGVHCQQRCLLLRFSVTERNEGASSGVERSIRKGGSAFRPGKQQECIRLSGKQE